MNKILDLTLYAFAVIFGSAGMAAIFQGRPDAAIPLAISAAICLWSASL